MSSVSALYSELEGISCRTEIGACDCPSTVTPQHDGELDTQAEEYSRNQKDTCLYFNHLHICNGIQPAGQSTYFTGYVAERGARAMCTSHACHRLHKCDNCPLPLYLYHSCLPSPA